MLVDAQLSETTSCNTNYIKVLIHFDTNVFGFAIMLNDATFNRENLLDFKQHMISNDTNRTLYFTRLDPTVMFTLTDSTFNIIVSLGVYCVPFALYKNKLLDMMERIISCYDKYCDKHCSDRCAGDQYGATCIHGSPEQPNNEKQNEFVVVQGNDVSGLEGETANTNNIENEKLDLIELLASI